MSPINTVVECPRCGDAEVLHSEDPGLHMQECAACIQQELDELGVVTLPETDEAPF